MSMSKSTCQICKQVGADGETIEGVPICIDCLFDEAEKYHGKYTGGDYMPVSNIRRSKRSRQLSFDDVLSDDEIRIKL